jgi:macrolide-efflux protein
MLSTPTGQQAGVADDRRAARNLRAFRLIWVTQLVARVGNGMTAFGLGVFVYQETGQTTPGALIMLAAFLPGLLLAPLAGVLVDRFDRCLMMILSDTLSAIGLVALLLAFHSGVREVWVICACVAFSSVFEALLDPAYRATVTDLLTPEQYARASGMTQLAAAAQYLISPAVAGLVMVQSGIDAVLMIDVATMVTTVSFTVVVWRTIKADPKPAEKGFWEDFRGGLVYFARNRGIVVLMLLVTLMTFCMGFLQTLLTPMMLDLTDGQTLGLVRSAAAIGMVVASLAIGVFNMGSNHIGYLAVALACGGVVVIGLGMTTSVLLIGATTFLFFMVLPPLNTSVEVLTRSWIPNETQGRIWGLMGLVSQLGFLAAYCIAGPLADNVFNPLLRPGGALADTLGGVIGTGPSRGIGAMFMLVGVLLILIAVVMPRVKSIRVLERHLKRQLAESREEQDA